MVIFSYVNLKQLSQTGRDYSWERPSTCPCCNSHRLWGHGYARAIFDGFLKPLLLKLFRCPDCRSVHRIRPIGYFKRFQATVGVIRASIEKKSKRGKWLPGISRSRQRHWYNAFIRHVSSYWGNLWYDTVKAFDHMVNKGTVAVSRAI